MALPDAFASRIALIAADRESGASEILDAVLTLLREAIELGIDVVPVAGAICRAQPGMASAWNAAVAAASGDPVRFEEFAARAARAPAALARFGLDAFITGTPPAAGPADAASPPLRVVTLSFSRSVAVVLETLAARYSLRVSCAEGRPALEGRRLASRLAAMGAAVTVFSDAAIGHALGGTDAVIVGADAVTPEWFLNKSGTRMLAAAAQHQSVPLYVVASRDKFVDHAVASRLRAREGSPAEIWDAPPAGVSVRNPYFEATPIDLAAAFITDAGVLGAALVPDVCTATTGDIPPGLLAKL